MAHLVISCLFTNVPFFCSFFQSSHLLMPISFFIILNPSFYACSFLHNSLHTSICELHYSIPFLSHRILIMHMLLALYSCLILHSFSLLLIYHNLPFPPSHLMLPFLNHITHPHAFIITLTYLCISLHHYPCTFFYAFLFVHLIMASSSMCMSLFPFEMFMSRLHYISLCLHLTKSSAPRFDNKLTKTDR